MEREGLEPSTPALWVPRPKDRLSLLSGRYLIVGKSFYYGSAGRDGVAAIWAPKSTVEHRRITRNSRGLVQPGEAHGEPAGHRGLADRVQDRNDRTAPSAISRRKS